MKTLIFIFLAIFVIPLHARVQIPGYESRAVGDVKQVGLALKLYSGDHAGKLPESLDILFPIYVSKKDILEHTLLTVPSMDITALPETCIVAIRTIPENSNRVAVVYPDTSATVLRIAVTSEYWPPKLRALVLFGTIGWLSFLVLWFRYRLRLKHA